MADVGTKLIFENEQVRVWEFTAAGGEHRIASPRTRLLFLSDRGWNARGYALQWSNAGYAKRR